ncbi:glycosyltransferase [Streptomyces sp. NPDC060194]|uniref:glycosyltransferase n=1 Tax=Streptomyces sp. NPDC060194 TaxID=3347069 RepID=UPI003659EDE2
MSDDDLITARAAFYRDEPDTGPPSSGRHPAGGLLAGLLAAEYGPGPHDGDGGDGPRDRPSGHGPYGGDGGNDPHDGLGGNSPYVGPGPHDGDGPVGGPTPDDLATASLRRAVRLGLAPAPYDLLDRALDRPHVAAPVLELWPRAVRRHGPGPARDALRARLLAPGPRPAEVSVLLELAAGSALHPLTAEEAAALAAAATDRRERHALWRYLHLVPGGAPHLPAPSAAGDVYERLLLSPPTALPKVVPKPDGLLVAQTMLLGGLDSPGHGLSGGLSVLLGGLGDHLASTSAAAGVLTVVTADHHELARDPRPVRERSPGHWVLRLPVDAPAGAHRQHTPAHRAALTWWAVRLLGLLPRPVDVLHVRYADDASLALARAAELLGSRLVFTATPDPHRQFSERHARTTSADGPAAERLRDDLHRVFVADRLVHRAHAVLGIPGRGGTEELLRHFPLLRTHNCGKGPAAPPEGIPAYRPAPDEAVRREETVGALFAGGDGVTTLAPEDRHLPLLLSVGRLHPTKQQDLLVDAWLHGGLWRETTLVLVGGAVEHPSDTEQDMRARVHAMLRAYPGAARRLALMPALPNAEVRRLEHALAETAGLNAWYVCPSRKEEFGLAVLEAMEAGLPVGATRRGGVPHYLRDGVNGVLLDTSTRPSLASGLRRLVAVGDGERRRMAEAGRRTVLRRFSVAEMADVLAREYGDVCL